LNGVALSFWERSPLFIDMGILNRLQAAAKPSFYNQPKRQKPNVTQRQEACVPTDRSDSFESARGRTYYHG